MAEGQVLANEGDSSNPVFKTGPEISKKIAIHQVNHTYEYLNKEDVRGHFSQQFPTIANPAPLGLCAFALTTFVLSMMNAGAIVSK